MKIPNRFHAELIERNEIDIKFKIIVSAKYWEEQTICC